jgi:nucleoside-diphosphate-sugar epimerase
MGLSKILVTGASGFIGSKVALTLAKELPGSDIIGVGRSNGWDTKNPLRNYKYISCDLLDDKGYKDLPGKVDAVIHMAGDRRTFVDANEYTAQAVSNILMTSKVSDYALRSRASLFIYASSVNVYTGNAEQPFKENLINIPIDNLGASKLAAEALLKARAIAGQFKVLAFRIFTVYGPGARHDQFIPQAILKLLSSDTVAKFGPPDIKRDFVYLDDVVSAILSGLIWGERDFTLEVFNVGTGIATSIRQVVHLMADLIGTEKKIEFNAFSHMINRADLNHQADLTRIKSVLGWQPTVSLREGLRQTVNSLSSSGQ